MTSSDLWDAETAQAYDESSAFMFAPDVLEPALRFWPIWPATARPWNSRSARDGWPCRWPSGA